MFLRKHDGSHGMYLRMQAIRKLLRSVLQLEVEILLLAMWPHSNCLESLRLEAWVFAVCLCFFVLWRHRPSDGWIPRPESPSTWLRIHTRRTIPGAQQTASVQEKGFVLTLQNLHVLPTSTRCGSITKLCQIFVQMWLNGIQIIKLSCRMSTWCEGRYMSTDMRSFTDRFMFTNINTNIFRWSLVNCVSICILLTCINSDM
jgi:hypothetical protein